TPQNVKQPEINIQRATDGHGFRLVASMYLPRPRAEVFAFFADAFRLQDLTPSWLHFEVLSPRSLRIEQRTLIDYRLRLRGVPLRWQSRISVWEPPLRFVDEQMRGPYRRWHHEHQFEEVPGGTLCRDVVDYDVLGGRLVHTLVVRRDLEKIFAFRHQKLRE